MGSRFVRSLHRWLSVIFTVAVAANFVAMGLGGGQAPPWITYSPLPPLFLLLFSGWYLFLLPYARRRTGAAASGGGAGG